MRKTPVAFLVSLTLIPGWAAAQNASGYNPPDFISTAPELPDTRGALSLRLSDAIATAAKNNLGLVLTREAVRIGELGVSSSEAAFEPVITAAYSHSSVDAPPSTSQEGNADEILTFVNDDWQIGASKRFATGTSISLDFRNGRADSSLGTAVQPLNYRSSVEARLTQPLLRGFSLDLDVPRIDVLRARVSSERERERLAVALMDVAQRTETAYWSVVSALKTYEVQKASLALARAQIELTKKQIEAGVLAPADEIEAESTLAQRELQLLRARRGIEAASDQLRAILNLPRDEWKRPIRPVDTPTFTRSELDASEALELALANRPEIRQSKLDLSRAAYDRRQAENNRLPQIDLGLSYSLVGQDQRYGNALERIGEAEAPAWSVLLSLSWTPLGKGASAAAKISRSSERIARAQNEQVVQNLYAEVRDAVRGLESAERELLAAARFRQLAVRSLDAEQRKFIAGSSSNFLVAQRSESVAQAQLAELGALIAHQNAAVSLERSTGRLLEARNVRLE